MQAKIFNEKFCLCSQPEVKNIVWEAEINTYASGNPHCPYLTIYSTLHWPHGIEYVYSSCANACYNTTVLHKEPKYE